MTVAVCTWNRAALLEGALAAMCDVRVPAGWAWEVLVVDNGSTDDTAETARAFADRLPLRLVSEPRRGTSHARNRAIDEARGEWVVFTDDDARVDAGWLVAFAAAVQRNPRAAAIGGRIVAGFPTPPDPLLAAAFPMLATGFCGLDYGVDEAPTERPMFTANLAFRRDALASLRFNPALGHGSSLIAGEDADLLQRVRQAGGTAMWCPTMRVSHVVARDRMTVRYLARYCAGYAEGLVTLRGASDTALRCARQVAVNGLLCALLWYPRRQAALHRLRYAAHWYGTLRGVLRAGSSG